MVRPLSWHWCHFFVRSARSGLPRESAITCYRDGETAKASIFLTLIWPRCNLFLFVLLITSPSSLRLRSPNGGNDKSK